MVGIKEEGYSYTKMPSKIPVARRPTRKKPKDKPKRPLSAYNFFFKEEREKILKLLAGDKDVENNPEDDRYIDAESLNRLRKGEGANSKSPKFEELGKLIGQRWKALPPDRLTKYSELASEDTERYKKEMQAYNGRQEAKMRDEALKPPSYPPPPPPSMRTSPSLMGMERGPPPGMPPGYDMGPPGYAPNAPGYGYPMDSYGYPPNMGGMYGGGPIGGYPQYGGGPGPGGGGGYDMGPPPPYDMGGAGGVYGMNGAPGGLMGYGGPPGGPAYPPMDPQAMYGGYGGPAGWSGQQP